jgi:hypothetical protein
MQAQKVSINRRSSAVPARNTKVSNFSLPTNSPACGGESWELHGDW